VVRFTPRVQDTFNLLAADVGRPISDITHKLRYDALIADAERVLDRLASIEREIATEDERCFLARISPYRTLDDKISGVVVTLIDVTQVKRVEAELRESEGRFRAMFEQASVGIVQIAEDGRFIAVNRGFCDFIGYGEAELEAMRVRDVTNPEDYPHEEELTRQLVAGEIPDYTIEKRYVLKDGGTVWGAMTATFVRRESGEPLYTLAIVQAIGDRKEAEAAQRASEERVRMIADNVPQLIWTNDGDGIANYFNKRWFDYSGLSHEESYGPGWQAMVHPEDAPASVERWQQALAKGEVFDAEYRLRGADGEYRWFIGRNVPLRDDGAVLGWFGTATDINDFKDAQARLAETEERLRVLIEGARDYAMFLLDLDNVITYWSKGAERVFGWTAEEAIGRSGELVFTPEDRAREEEEKEIEVALRDGSAPDRRWHLRKDGQRIWVDGVMHRLTDDKTGALRGFAKVARDATEQRAIGDKLQRARDELEQRVHDRTKELQAMNETLEQEMARRQLLEREILEVTERERATISQDLHDSLCQELTATAFLLKSRAKSLGDSDPEAGEALIESAEMVNRNAGLARDFARGLHPLALGSGGLVSALRELAARTSQTVTCHCECPRSLRVPSEQVAVNLYRIAQEAVTNAVKHAKPNQIVICIERMNGNIHLVITDNGRGRRQFRPAKGGLGIQMMQYRAKVCGGTLEISSKKGKGTRVSCSVPAK
jgi:PAS domain S-box-containing protein